MIITRIIPKVLAITMGQILTNGEIAIWASTIEKYKNELKIKYDFVWLKKRFNFAPANKERPHRHTKTQRDGWKVKTVSGEKKQMYLQRVKWGFGNRLNEAIKPKSF